MSQNCAPKWQKIWQKSKFYNKIHLLGKFLALVCVVGSFSDHSDKVLRQNERNALSIDTQLLLAMVEEMTKINMEYLNRKYKKFID